MLLNPAHHLPVPDLSYPDYHPDYHLSFAPQSRPRNANNIDLVNSISSTVDTHHLPLSHHQPSSSPEHLPDSPSSVPSSYNYVPRRDNHSTPSPDAMYQHHVHPTSNLTDLYPQSNNNTNANHTPNPDPYHIHPSQSRRSPPSILTDNLIPNQDADPGPYSASPLSSPSDPNFAQPQQSRSAPFSFPQPMSAPHSQNIFPGRFPPPDQEQRYAYPTQTLDRRMSEPVLGGGRPSYALPPPQHDPFAFSSSASSASTVHPSPLSPRPTSSYSYQGHHRAGSGASIGSAGFSDAYAQPNAGWTPGLKHAEFDHEAALASPLYAASAASGSDMSATGMPSPPTIPRQAPPKGTRTPAGAGRTNSSKTYSFVSLPGNAVKKRPRRRYDEIERLYQCSWPNCTKAYGTLNHLNAHVQMQRHGAKRSPGEFKELRKQWRQAKKEADEAEREREREAHALAAMHHHHHLPHAHELDHRLAPRRRLSVAEPYPDPHAYQHLYAHQQQHAHPQHQHQQHFASASPPGYALQGPGMAMDARYHLQSPAEDIPQFRYPPQLPPPQQHQHQQAHPEEGLQEMAQQFYRAGNGGGEMGAWQQQQQGEVRSMSMTRPLQPFYSGAGGVTLPPLGAFSPQDGAPELVAHVSLGTNRLPPDSTLLTPLPGYEPDAAQEMERRMERMMGQGQHGQGARPEQQYE